MLCCWQTEEKKKTGQKEPKKKEVLMSVFSMTVISLKIKSEKQIKKQKKRQIIMEILITNAINIFFY